MPLLSGARLLQAHCAVLSLLKTQKRPIERLFSDVDDRDHYENDFSGDYLGNSMAFEQALAEHPAAAAHVYPNKETYNDLRFHPKKWNAFFERYPESAEPSTFDDKPKPYLDPDIERYFAQYQPQKQISSGASFLQNINLPEPQYFKPLTENETTEMPLALEVTLRFLPYSIYWGNSDYRAFVSLRIASQQQGKFYKISNIDSFLTKYLTETDYQPVVRPGSG